MFTLQITGACAGEVTICSQHYGSVYNKHDKSDWVYRVVDGKKCWFPANGMKRGSEKPLDELRWPQLGDRPPVSIPTDSDPAKMQAPWDMEHRWQGDKQRARLTPPVQSGRFGANDPAQRSWHPQ